MKRPFADHYLPAELAGKSFMVVQVWLPTAPSLPMRQLYTSFFAQLLPGTDLAFCEAKFLATEEHLILSHCLPFVAAEVLPIWPLAIPMLPLPELLNEDGFITVGQEGVGKSDTSTGIILFGPESTGKSTLSRWLATRLEAPVAKEYVRLWFDVFGSDCSPLQAALIANVVCAFQQALACVVPKVWAADTDVLASWMWYEWYFGTLPSEVDLAALCKGKVYLLMADDIAFEPDHQRCYVDRREFDTAYAEAFLQRAGATYCLVSGSGEAREASAFNALKRLGVLLDRK